MGNTTVLCNLRSVIRLSWQVNDSPKSKSGWFWEEPGPDLFPPRDFSCVVFNSLVAWKTVSDGLTGRLWLTFRFRGFLRFIQGSHLAASTWLARRVGESFKFVVGFLRIAH